jgi:hypothetical protein
MNDTTTHAAGKDPCWVNVQISGSCWEWMVIDILVASECKYKTADDNGC